MTDKLPELPIAPCCSPDEQRAAEPCCQPAAPPPESGNGEAAWIEGHWATPTGSVPRVKTQLTRADRLGTWKARWGIGRMRYRIEPGLYAVGSPDAASPVLVSANYKLSFDRLRQELGGQDAWLLVLETRGINVWCAAGKGTFGTDEIVRRVEDTGLADIVTGRTLVLPQLGAPGVQAHEVKRRCGFRAVYGPVRAEDLPAFLAAGMQADEGMREVRFPWPERLALVPVELVMTLKYIVLAAAAMMVLAGLGGEAVWSLDRALLHGGRSVALLLAGVLGGVAVTPLLLPWLPGRAFSVKGAYVGVALAAAAVGLEAAWPGAVFENTVTLAAWMLLLPAVASFLGMNFTGASTYTSLSGVRREMRVAVPLQAGAAAVGLVLWLVARFV